MTGRSRKRRWVRRWSEATAAVLFLLAIYLFVVRPWHIHWGATPEEVSRHLPGDDLVPNPQEVTTRAITINAEPKHVWPWLAQMGEGRGGLYSYDNLDRLFGVITHASSDTVISRYQHLKAGDTIPIGESGGWPVALVRCCFSTFIRRVRTSHGYSRLTQPHHSRRA